MNCYAFLRGKMAEEGALQDLTREDRGWITPVIELLPPNETEGHLEDDGSMCYENNIKYPSIPYTEESYYIDPRHLFFGVGQDQARLYVNALIDRVGLFCPSIVVHPFDLEYSMDVQEGLVRELRPYKIAIRFPLFEVGVSGRIAELEQVVSKYQRLQSNQRDQPTFFCDIGYVTSDSDIREIVADRLRLLIEGVKNCKVVLVGGSFPRDMRSIPAHSSRKIERCNYVLWLSLRKEVGISNLCFGDYGIQHPVYYPTPDRPRVSANIRYTTSEEFVVYRGEAISKDKPGQYPSMAQMLMDDPTVYEADISTRGDDYVAKVVGGRTDGPGSPTTWLRAGFSRYLAMIAHQMRFAVMSNEAEIRQAEYARSMRAMLE